MIGLHPIFNSDDMLSAVVNNIIVKKYSTITYLLPGEEKVVDMWGAYPDLVSGLVW